MRRVFGIAILALLALVMALQALKLRTRVSLNKAIYLINQQKWSEAEGHLQRFQQTSTDNPESLEMLARVHLAQGKYSRALEILKGLPTTAVTAFARGVCEYQLGNDQASASSFAIALSNTAGKIHPHLRTLAQMAVNNFTNSIDITLLRNNPPDHPAYETLLLGFAGRSEFNHGDFKHAGKLLQEALNSGDLNPGTRAFCVTAFAADGNFSQAHYMADYSVVPAIHQRAKAIATQKSDEIPTRSVSLSTASWAAETSQSLRRAELWAEKNLIATTASNQLQSLAETMTNIVRANPDDLPTSLLLGEVLESLGRDRDAFTHYQEMLQFQPSFATRLRVHNLAVGKSMLAPLDFLPGDTFLANLSPDDFKSTNTIVRDNHLAFFSRTSAESTILIPRSETYEISLIARGDAAFGLSPVCTLQVDGQTVEKVYVYRDSWECYSFIAMLEAGKRHIKLEYTNNSDRLLSSEEDRNLYVAGVIVSKGAQ